MALRTRKRRIGISLGDAAKELGLHHSTLYRMVQRGEMKARKYHGKRGLRISKTTLRNLRRGRGVKEVPQEFWAKVSEDESIPNLPMAEATPFREDLPQEEPDCLSVTLSFEKDAMRAMVREIVKEEIEEIVRGIFHSEVSSQIEAKVAEKLKGFKVTFGS